MEESFWIWRNLYFSTEKGKIPLEFGGIFNFSAEKWRFLLMCEESSIFPPIFSAVKLNNPHEFGGFFIFPWKNVRFLPTLEESSFICGKRQDSSWNRRYLDFSAEKSFFLGKITFLCQDSYQMNGLSVSRGTDTSKESRVVFSTLLQFQLYT